MAARGEAGLGGGVLIRMPIRILGPACQEEQRGKCVFWGGGGSHSRIWYRAWGTVREPDRSVGRRHSS